MSHFKTFCECGKLISQCKCPSMDKTVRVVKPCIHIIASVTSTKPMDYATLLSAKYELENQGEIPNVLRCHPSVYNAIRLYFHAQETEDMLNGVQKPELPATFLGNIFGVIIEIDQELKAGEWKFERRFYD